MFFGDKGEKAINRYFLITVDTEGDNLWTPVFRSYGMRNISTENASYIERFQKLCNKYGFIPTYLVDYEMTSANSFVSNAKEWVKNGQCEIGMHMHSWNSPPIYDLRYKKSSNNPYAGDYPKEVMWKKMEFLTDRIEKKFGVRPKSHRGGRWYIDPWYIKALMKLGYWVDCSVTPGISWKSHIGYEIYGCDYRRYPQGAYYMNGSRLYKKCQSGILEIPPTIKSPPFCMLKKDIIGNSGNIMSVARKKIWLRPNGSNLEEMLYLAETEDEYIEFMIHSSELMPGGSPTFKTDKSIEKLYKDLEILFNVISLTRMGIGLVDYAEIVRRRK